ncbi:MAG: polysaccharide pyruvyl transferase family protein [Isosphaeraceae bacterium]|nr:polysaccharide pyruvyl transferase family protein [Isosphaeraceae bacterium]
MVTSSKVLDVFREFRDRPFVFVEPGGNFGDQLIYRGAEKLAAGVGLRFCSISYQEFVRRRLDREEVVYIHGGGGCVPWWSGTPIAALKRLLQIHSGVVIVGPQTFWTEPKFLRRVLRGVRHPRPARIILFTREAISWKAVREHAPIHTEVIADHDTALNLSADDLGISRCVRQGDLWLLRKDKEAPRRSPHVAQAVDPIATCATLEEWLEIHNSARTIVTNRLHSAIVASILDIPAVLFPNNYFKNAAVWEFSLKSRGVLWSDVPPPFDTSVPTPGAEKSGRVSTGVSKFSVGWHRKTNA